MAAISISSLCLYFLGAPPEVPSFAEVWYQEVVDGALSQAAARYERIYTSALSESTPVDRTPAESTHAESIAQNPAESAVAAGFAAAGAPSDGLRRGGPLAHGACRLARPRRGAPGPGDH